MYSLAEKFKTIEEAGDYISSQMSLVKHFLPVSITISDEFVGADLGWFKVVNITFIEARGKDVRKIRSNGLKGSC